MRSTSDMIAAVGNQVWAQVGAQVLTRVWAQVGNQVGEHFRENGRPR